MRVVIINRSDALGGAAIASSRLCGALRQQGVDARMLVVDRRTGAGHVQVAGAAVVARARWLAERLAIYWRNGRRRDTLFAIDTATQGLDLARHPWVRQADVVVLGWVNQAMLSLAGVEHLAQLGKPVVWVMHDMWNCTGVCHHSGECTQWQADCRRCPLLPEGSTLARDTWLRKQRLYAQGAVHFVAVSHWLRQMCVESSLMHDAAIDVIPNAIDASAFNPAASEGDPWHVAPGSKVVVMGAARLDDPIKGLDRLAAALQWLAEERPDVARRLHLVLYGGLRDRSWLERLAVPHTYLGYVDDLQRVYRHAHIVVSASTRESFGYTLVEGMACGCVAVTTGQGGQTDIVSHLKNGYIAPDLQPESLARALAWAVDTERSRQAQHHWVATHFDQAIVAQQHLLLYNRLLDNRQQQ